MRLSRALLVALVLVVPMLASPAAASSELPEVDEYLHGHRELVGSPGLAYAIIRGDEIVAQQAIGADGDGAPLTSRTPFLLGSVAKPFTGVAVMALVEAGDLALDDPVVDTLEWFRMADPEVSDRITTEHLLTHTSGISERAGIRFADRFDNNADGLERSVRVLEEAEPEGEPGETFRYSSANYMVLGALVEQVSGTSYGDYLREHVLDPLRMRDAIVDAGDAQDRLPPGHRLAFDRAWSFDTEYDTSGLPYGYLGASLEDLTHFAIAELGGGHFDGSQILSAEGIERTHEARVETSSGGYGYGWRIRELDGLRTVHHSGATAGFMSSIVLVPEQDLAVIVMHNAHGMARDAQQYEAAFDVVRLLNGDVPRAVGADPVLASAPWVLLAVAVLMITVLGRSALRGHRGPRGHRGQGSRRSAVTWIGAALVLAVAVGWLLPRQFGADLNRALLWAPDIAIGIIAVLAACALVVITQAVPLFWRRHDDGRGQPASAGPSS